MKLFQVVSEAWFALPDGTDPCDSELVRMGAARALRYQISMDQFEVNNVNTAKRIYWTDEHIVHDCDMPLREALKKSE